MYIHELKLWNFRKFGGSNWDLNKPHLNISFNKGLNVLIGENDSGKSAILDAIKLVLKTHAYEWIKIEDNDFYNGCSKFRIEIIFNDLSVSEASHFTEWLGWEGDHEDTSPILRVIYQIEKRDDKIIPSDLKAGMDEVGYSMNAEARDYLKTTYLKALRHADNELIAKKNSRVSQIFQGHDLFKKRPGQVHDFVTWFDEVNSNIETWFKDENAEDGKKSNKEQIKDVIDFFLHSFIDDQYESKLKASEQDIKSILDKITLGIDNSTNLGLGTMNRLYMAAELLHLKKEWDGLKLCMIEELEAHLHPQAQMKVVEALQKEKNVQFILSTHSPNLASKVNIQNIIICKDGEAFPLRKSKTLLEGKNYRYLKRFLDVTKSNLFFAKGVIIVEGWAEEILIPAIANSFGYDLTKHEVSIVNVGSTAYLHFAKIFLRKDGKSMNIPVSVVTDLDIRPDEDNVFDCEKEENKREKIKDNFKSFEDTDVKLYIAKQWTLEWCLCKSISLSRLFKEAVSEIHPKTTSFKSNEDGSFNENFEKKLSDKLKKIKGTSSLDKVAIANVLAEKIEKAHPEANDTDDYIKYIIDAIKHACRI